jgi:hypothetical protein
MGVARGKIKSQKSKPISATFELLSEKNKNITDLKKFVLIFHCIVSLIRFYSCTYWFCILTFYLFTYY